MSDLIDRYPQMTLEYALKLLKRQLGSECVIHSRLSNTVAVCVTYPGGEAPVPVTLTIEQAKYLAANPMSAKDLMDERYPEAWPKHRSPKVNITGPNRSGPANHGQQNRRASENDGVTMSGYSVFNPPRAETQTEITKDVASQRTALPARSGEVSILSVGHLDEDHLRLINIAVAWEWKVYRALTCREAADVLGAKNEIPVVLCERELRDGGWKDILKIVEEHENAPLLIVASRLADEALWAEVLNFGGYDVLLTPYETEEVVRVINVATMYWKRQQNPRAS